MLVCVKEEINPYCENAVAIFAYFDNTPAIDELFSTLKEKYKNITMQRAVDECSFQPKQFQDKVADLAKLERWYLCQFV